MQRLLLGVLLLLAACPRHTRGAAVVCDTRASSVALVQAACAADSACTFATARLTPAALDVLLVDRLHLITTSADAVSDDDVRQRTQPDTWVQPLLAWNAAAATTNCTALAAMAGSAAPPPEITALLYALFVYRTLQSDDSACTAVNEVPVYDATDGVFRCACAIGRVCTASTTTNTMLLTVLSLFIIVAVVVLLAGVVPLVWTLRARPPAYDAVPMRVRRQRQREAAAAAEVVVVAEQ
jgi:hypothetical protein